MGLIKITATLLSDRSVTTTKEIMILDHPRVYIEGEKTVTVGHTYDYKARVEPFESQPQEVEWSTAAEESVAEISSLDSTTGQLVVHSNGGQEGYRFAIYAREKGQNSDYDTMYVTVINPPTSFNVVLNEAASHTDGHIYPNRHLNL